MRRIDPKYQFRFTHQQIRGSYATLEDAFAAGDFNLVAAEAEDPQLKGAARVLMGLPNEGLALLEAQADLGPRGRLVKAFAHWILDAPAEALGLLDTIPADDPHAAIAADLAAAIATPRLDVLITSQMAGVNMEVDSGEEPAAEFGQFRATFVATQRKTNAYGIEAEAALPDQLAQHAPSSAPVFALTLGTQWLLPKDYEKLTCPRIILHNDQDVYFFRAGENYNFHDVHIVCTSQEHFELNRTIPRTCYSYLMSDPFAAPFPEPSPGTEKQVDIFFSGRALEAWENDRARFLFDLCQLSDIYKIVIVQGHMSFENYVGTLRASRFMPVLNRYAGNPSPRWRDAMSSGVMILAPEGAPYDQITSAAFVYDPANLRAGIAAHIEASRAGERAYDLGRAFEVAAAYRVANAIPRPKRFERFLKTCTFFTLLDRHFRPERRIPPVATPRRRVLWLIPAVDLEFFGFENIMTKVMRCVRPYADLRVDMDEKDFNNTFQTLNSMAIFTGIVKNPGDEVKITGIRMSESKLRNTIADRATAVMNEGLRRFPNSLILRINEIYWMLLGGTKNHARAEQKLAAVISSFDKLTFDPVGSDIGGATIHWKDPWFSYFDYAETVLCWDISRRTGDRPIGRTPIEPRNALAAFARLMLAEIVATREDWPLAISLAREATVLFPDNHYGYQCLFKHALAASEVDGADGSAAETAVEAFFAAANRFPGFTLKALPRAIEPLRRLLDDDEMRDLVDSWVRFARAIHWEELNAAIPLSDDFIGKLFELAHLSDLLAPFRKLWPSYTASDGATLHNHFDRRLFRGFVASVVEGKLRL